MKKYAVVGVGYGDEGKGTVVDTLCSQNRNQTLIVRYSGGHQVGHTVKIGEKIHEFRHFGSGTLRGCPTLWKVMVFPPDFQIERETLVNKFNINPEICFLESNPVTTIYDVAYNRVKDFHYQHGSTGKGVASTLRRNELISLTVGDLKYGLVVLTKLKYIREYYESLILKNGFSKEYFESELFISDSEFIKSCEYLINHSLMDIPGEYLINSYSTIIYEGNQGLLLDPKIGFYPHVTYTNCGIPDCKDLDEVFYVTRCYASRHGNGPLHHEEKLDLVNNEVESNHTNPYQGNFRTGYLDVDLVNYAMCSDLKDNSLKSNLVITCLDQIKDPEVFYKGSKIKLLNNLDLFSAGSIYLKSTPDSFIVKS